LLLQKQTLLFHIANPQIVMVKMLISYPFTFNVSPKYSYIMG